MNRRSFLASLSALPLIGKLLPQPDKPRLFWSKVGDPLEVEPILNLQVRDEIALYTPEASPLLALAKKLKAMNHPQAPHFDWLEDSDLK